MGLEEGGFAANGVKHCVRPVDMSGKSSAFILRRMREEAVKLAKVYEEVVDFPGVFSCLSLKRESVPYHVQCEIQNGKRLKEK